MNLQETVLARADLYETMLDKNEVTYNTDGTVIRGADNAPPQLSAAMKRESMRKNARSVSLFARPL